MKTSKLYLRLACWLSAALFPMIAGAQSAPLVDCDCLRKLTVLQTNACQAFVPDLCLLATNCFSPQVTGCSQNPTAGTPVGPGTTFITLTVLDNQGLADQCVVPFVVTPAPGCVFTLLCATNKTVECGSTWTFDPPAWTNACAPPPGTPSNGVVLTVVSTVTNGSCPEIITQTWQGVDDCGNTAQCSQTVTVADTQPPQIDCRCLTNNAVAPVNLTVYACTSTIPDLCLAASVCAHDSCGLVACTQSPPAGTPVGVGVYPITVTVYDCASNAASCTVNFTVLPPAGGCNTNPCVTPPAGMVGWWPLDETCGAGVFADVTGSGNAALVESGGPVCSGGSPNAVPGKVAGANYFYMPTVRGRAPNAPSLNFGTGSFGLDAWVNPVLTGPIHWHPIVDKLQQTGPATGFGYKVGLLNSNVVLIVGDGTLYTHTSAGAVNFPAWNFVGVSVDRTANTVTFHVNGVTEPFQALAPAGTFNSPVDLLIGGTYALNDPYGELAIDELELFNRALAAAEFTLLFQADSLGKCKPVQPCTNSVVSIFCPPNISTQLCAVPAIVVYPAPVASTSCGTITNLVCLPPSGSPFPLGTTTVTCTATDSQGQTASCTFTVTVTQPIQTNVWNTGMGGPNGNVPLPAGTPDPNYALISAPPGGCAGPAQVLPANLLPAPPWVANGPNSQWIGVGPTPDCQGGVYIYRLCFTLPCTDGAAIIGQWAADDIGEILLNGLPTGNTILSPQYPNLPAYGWFPVAITNGFVCGVNCLDFYVTNAAGGFNPTGLRAELTNLFSACCQPCTNTNCTVSITCPTNLTVATCHPAGETVNYLAPIASSTCGVITNLVCVPPSGSVFPVGTNTVICTATDAQGNSASCTFTIIVAQTLPPYTVNCPPLLNLSVSGCPPVMPDLTQQITIGTNCVLDCPITITQSIPPGTPLTYGSHVVIIRTCDCQGRCTDCDMVIRALPSPNCCETVPVLRLFSGATNNPPGALPGWTLDPQFLTGAPYLPGNPFVQSLMGGSWVPNTSSSAWVGPAGYPNTGAVLWYTNRFLVCSTNQAQITGRWTSDNTARIWLNGAPTTNVLTSIWSFTSWHPVSITSGFVPGWNELVFAVTNVSYGPAGLRTELTGSACCTSCVTIACPTNIVTGTCAGAAVVNFPAPVVTSACNALVSVTTSPPSGSVFPVGTTVVTCSALDAAGNAAQCTFTVTVVNVGQPVAVKCPPSRTIYTCGSNAVAYYQPSATGQVGPVTCLPPSGSTFPLGTNTVVCTATNGCGGISTCSFQVIVKPASAGPPNLTVQAGLADNFAPPGDAAVTTPCLASAAVAVYPFASFAGFDGIGTPWLGIYPFVGHRFGGLPGNIVKAELVVRMKPGNDSSTPNDRIYVGITGPCNAPTFLYNAQISTLPGAGGTWVFGLNGPTTFTFDLGALNPALISHLNTNLGLDVLVGDTTVVDYMQLRLWLCPPPIIVPSGLSYLTALGANVPSALVFLPQPELPAFGPIGQGAAVAVRPPDGNPTLPNAAGIAVGGGQAYSFTTILDMNAPEGAEILISVPAEGGTNVPLFSLVKGRCEPKCHWDIKAAKKFFDDGGSACRVSAVSTNGDLLDSFTATEAEAAGDSLLTLTPEPGVDEFPVSILYEATKGQITVTFPGSVARRLCNGLPCPRGWDGTIKGNFADEAARRKGWDGTVKCPCYDENASRIVFTPASSPGHPLPASLVLSSTGLGELVIAGEHLHTMGHEVSATQEGAVMLHGTAAGDGVVLTSLEDMAGVTLDLGRAASFEVGLHHFENGDIPSQEQWFLIGGPKWPIGLTNRPPPPPILLRLAPLQGGIEGSADFTGLGATGITISLLSNGVPVSTRFVPGPSMPPEDALVLDHWPERFALLGTNGVLRLTSVEPFTVAGAVGDEVRFTPELPPGAPPFDYASELQCLTTAGMESLLYDLKRVAACAPTALNVMPTSSGTVMSWAGDGYRLLGAETLSGPWIELGTASPVVLAPNAPQRYYRLVCE